MAYSGRFPLRPWPSPTFPAGVHADIVRGVGRSLQATRTNNPSGGGEGAEGRRGGVRSAPLPVFCYLSKDLRAKTQMPRRSAASLTVVSALVGRRSRLRPPPTLSEPERTAFIDTVSSCKPEHFQMSDMPLLVRYCEAAVLAQQAATQLRVEGAVVGGRVSPWLCVQEKAIRELVALSMRLRLSPQARAANNPSRPQPQASHYEKMALGNDNPKHDVEALELAIEQARAEDAGRRNQIDALLKEDWWDGATFASSYRQSVSLRLNPWELPPCSFFRRGGGVEFPTPTMAAIRERCGC